MNTGKRTQRYSVEFKVKAVEWSYQPHRSVKGVAEALDIHPMMLSRWRKEYRDGRFAMSRVKKAPADAKTGKPGQGKPGQIYFWKLEQKFVLKAGYWQLRCRKFYGL